MSKIISVINQKGGSGKTSFATMACIALAEKGKKVLAIDCDPQGGLSYFLCPGAKDNMSEVLLRKIVNPHTSCYDGVDIYTSSSSIDCMYFGLSDFAFKPVLKMVDSLELGYKYDYIIFDTPPTMQGITRAAIHVSDQIFVPCELSKPALEPTYYALKCIEELEKKGLVIFVSSDIGNTGHRKEIEIMFRNRIGDNYAGTIKRGLQAQKIVSGDIKLTPNKIATYLQPIYDLIEGETIE